MASYGGYKKSWWGLVNCKCGVWPKIGPNPKLGHTRTLSRAISASFWSWEQTLVFKMTAMVEICQADDGSKTVRAFFSEIFTILFMRCKRLDPITTKFLSFYRLSTLQSKNHLELTFHMSD